MIKDYAIFSNQLLQHISEKILKNNVIIKDFMSSFKEVNLEIFFYLFYLKKFPKRILF